MSCDSPESAGPELVIGLVSPVGMNTTDLANSVQRSLSDSGYIATIIKLSSLLPDGEEPPPGEAEDQRIRRLMSVGNKFCADNADSAAIARLGVAAIRAQRLKLLRADGNTDPASKIIASRPGTAYILQSLKRLEEVQLLRSIYGEQFILIGSQGSVAQRTANLFERNLSATDIPGKEAAVRRLFQIDASDPEPHGQNVTDTYPQADFFIGNNNSDEIDRAITLLFGKPEAPTVGEYAMYMARASRARSLAASRKVGAAIVVDGFVVSTGYNDVPEGQTTDVVQGIDTSEQFKRESLLDTLQRLKDAGMLTDAVEADEQGVAQAAEALKKGALMSTIEYQRAVHAEARAIDEATIRGISPAGGTLYVTTFPCHLCYKHALSVRLDRIEYIEPYPKSRAVEMFGKGAEDKLVPFSGVAPRRFMQIFDDRPAPMSVPPGIFKAYDRSAAKPLLGPLRDDEDRAGGERTAVNGLKEEYR
ncbi:MULTISPECIES: deaminase [unclassified Mycolicibacterium]|uniref:deaminase n=2 Tax=Mycolicibacterium TaxID=1866885 RepID=UPI0013909EFE|nr:MULTISPECIES: deaminase [unclassified Mycolicibacterium]